MIYTLTYSPSVDYLVYLDELEPGKLNMMKRDAIFYGGKGVNVSQVLWGLGIENTALGFVAGFTGQEIETGLNRLGCRTDFVHLKEGHSRINIKVKAREESEINAVGPRVDDESLEKLYEKLGKIERDDMLVLAGRTPKGVPEDMFARLIEKLPYRETKVIVDTTGHMLLNMLPYHPFLIKPNHIEVSELFNEQFSPMDTDRLVWAANKLQEKGARNVMISLAAEGAMLVTEEGKVYIRKAPNGTAVNSVGAGDSMVAGFIAGYLEMHNYEDAFVMGLAAGSASTFQEGLAKGDEIKQLYRLIR